MNESGTKQEIPMNFKLDDFYTTQEQRDEEKKEKIEEIDISLIDSYKTVETIKNYLDDLSVLV